MRAHAETSRKVELVVLGGLLLILGAMLFYGFFRVIVGDVTHCGEKRFATVWPTGVELAAVSVVGFVVGLLGLCSWSYVAGMSWGVAIAFFAAILAMMLSFARMVSASGLPAAQTDAFPSDLFVQEKPGNVKELPIESLGG